MSTVAQALQALQARSQAAAEGAKANRAAALASLSGGKRGSTRQAPSGPRAKGDGTNDEAQGILSFQELPSGGCSLRLTLLAAGFLVGPSGSSIRAVSDATGADIRSVTESWLGRRVRSMLIEGPPRSVVHALEVVSAAVERYAALTGGAYCGLSVERTQVVMGISFTYSPPPRAAVPYAAALRAAHERPSSPPLPKGPLDYPSPSLPREGKENWAGGASPLPVTPTAARRSQLLAALGAPASALAAPAARAHHAGVAPRLLFPAAMGSAAVGGEESSMDLEDMASTPAYRTAFGGGAPAGSGALASPALTATPDYCPAFGPPPLPSPCASAHIGAGHIGSGLGGFGASPGFFGMGLSRSGSGSGSAGPSFGQAFSGGGSVNAAAAPQYSLFSGGAGLGSGTTGGPLFQQEHPFSGGASVFASAFEPAAAAATPLVGAGAPLHRATSEQEDAVLSTCGFPSYSAFAQQSSFCSPAFFDGQAQFAAAAPHALPHLPPPHSLPQQLPAAAAMRLPFGSRF